MSSLTIFKDKIVIYRVKGVKNPVRNVLVIVAFVLFVICYLMDPPELSESAELIDIITIALLVVATISGILAFVFVPEVTFNKCGGPVRVSYFGFHSYDLCQTEDIASVAYITFSGIDWKKNAGLQLKDGTYLKIISGLPMKPTDEITNEMSRFLGLQAVPLHHEMDTTPLEDDVRPD
jgi:hypothetical protein